MTISINLDHCHIPGFSSLQAWLMLSIGIHNEPGYCKTSLLPLVENLFDTTLGIQLTHTVLDTMLDTTDSPL
ncbi:hypothetical protein BC936DRAFT_148756 [Jimgerdemannia flammicorona]|uniref:DhaK domain-containing protein n=1 Tax=Jimgerdemannia flammicorona TaxID=994334 RepID=A0A433D2C9_9FUNG|nr:hypothetical protein BC936DRAFT_148756 [Jimgerdemannia flammicorona]